MSKSTSHSDAALAALSFEDAMKELEQLVRKLEAGQIPLEDAIAHYTRGAELKALCEAKLKDARLKVEQIIARENASLATEPFHES